DRSTASGLRVFAKPSKNPVLGPVTRSERESSARVTTQGRTNQPTQASSVVPVISARRVQSFNPHRALWSAYCKSPYRERPGSDALLLPWAHLHRGAHDTALRISRQE